jgi:hypothetical protein
MDISLVMSSKRPQWVGELCESLKSNKCEYEVILVGDIDDAGLPECVRVIKTKVKPAQCWEIGMRAANGRLVCYTADDTTYSEGALDSMVALFDAAKDENIMAGFTTVEDGVDTTMNHRFWQPDNSSPLCSPVGVMTKKLWLELGGICKKFVGGQWENDISMRVRANGGNIIINTKAICYLDHVKKHTEPIPESTMVLGYLQGRSILEPLWMRGHHWTLERSSPVERFEDEGILEKSQGENKIVWHGELRKEWI